MCRSRRPVKLDLFCFRSPDPVGDHWETTQWPYANHRPDRHHLTVAQMRREHQPINTAFPAHTGTNNEGDRGFGQYGHDHPADEMMEAVEESSSSRSHAREKADTLKRLDTKPAPGRTPNAIPAPECAMFIRTGGSADGKSRDASCATQPFRSRHDLMTPSNVAAPWEEKNMADTNLIELTTDIVAAHVANNIVSPEELPTLIHTIFEALANAEKPAVPEAPKPEPAVAIRASIEPDHIVCLEDGQKLKTLKRYLRTKYNLSPEDYRAKWGLPRDYPMVAPAYAEQRRALAQQMGLGRKRDATPPRVVVESQASTAATGPSGKRKGGRLSIVTPAAASKP